jgi:two-component system, NarL family, response regulator LiaR
VVLIERDPLAQRVIRGALESAGVDVVAEAADGEQAVGLVLEHDPDLVLMDVLMPELEGLAATRAIIERRPDQVVVLLSSRDDESLMLTSLHAGAAGLVTKDLDPDALPRLLRGVMHGEAALSRRAITGLIEHLRAGGDTGRGVRPIRSVLTDREWEIVDLIAEGRTNDEIARSLVLSVETVRSHVKSVLRKLQVTSRQEAVSAAEKIRASTKKGGSWTAPPPDPKL